MSSIVTVKYTKAALKDPGLMRALDRAAMPVAIATANHIRKRVRDHGQTATPAQPYATHVVTKTRVSRRTKSGGQSKSFLATRLAEDSSKKYHYITGHYADKIGLKETRFPSSADFHAKAGTKLGTFKVSGGMWQGLQVRNSGNAAVIDFGGSSLGGSSVRSARVGRYKEETVTMRVSPTETRTTVRKHRSLLRDAGGQVLYRRKPKHVRNQDKAGAVYRHSRVGLLQPLPSETAAQAAAVAHKAGRVLALCFGADGVETGRWEGNGSLLRAILQEFNR